METMKETAAVAATQVCRDCGRELPIDNFRATRWGGHMRVCNDCVNAKRKPKSKRDIYSAPTAQSSRNPLLEL